MPIFVDPPPDPPALPIIEGRLIEIVWAQMPAYVDDADDGTGHALLEAACDQVDPIVDMISDPSVMVDPLRVPAQRLPWLAALAGVDSTAVPQEALRSFVADPTTRNRGNRAAIVQRVALTLTGSKTVQIECPYDDDPMQILVRTFTAETPDPTATAAAIRAEVPSWLALTIEVSDGIDYDALAVLYPSYDDMTASGKTYAELANLQP
jgi:hypothetical protein